MPLYEYQCKKCGHRFEKIQKFSDKMVKKCPECGGVVEQMISAPAVQFKGSGWYVTDYAKKPSAGSSSSTSSDSSSSDSSSSSSADSSKESKKDEKNKSESVKEGSKESSAKDSSPKDSSSKKADKSK